MDKVMKGSQCIMNLGVNSLCSNLGYLEDGYYVTSDDCEGKILLKVSSDICCDYDKGAFIIDWLLCINLSVEPKSILRE